jgi:hypothetical protein
MGVAIPQIITEDRASGALIVDGSLRFDSSKSQYLSRTPSSSGNQKTWTWSGWVKRNTIGAAQVFIGSFASSPNRITWYGFNSSNQLVCQIADGSSNITLGSASVYRDTGAWMHVMLACDTSQSTEASRLRFYVNGVEVVSYSGSYPPQNTDTLFNSTSFSCNIGQTAESGYNYYLNSYLSTTYFIDGQALTPSSFGYTDALTNTWRPKKLSSSVAFGTNGFYLPFDGSAPIGQDQSGRGNNWTPVNFGGSNTLEKATGALPILNTDGGGKVARVGVRTDSSASSLVLALPLVGIKSDFSNAINSGTSNKAVTNNGVSFSSSYSNFYGGSGYFNKSETDFLTVGSASDWVAFNNGSDFTFETWFYPTSTGGGGGTHHCLFETNGGATTVAVGLVIGIDSNGAVRYFLGKGSSPAINLTTDNGLVSVGVWNHIAVSQQSKIIRIFINGVIRYTYDASSYAFPSSNPAYPLYIGKLTDAYWIADGYIQDYRLYTSAKYTQNFIPASTDPDILPDTPSGVSYTSNLTQITDGAVAFGANTDYLNIGSSNDYSLPGDFTVELYLNASFPYTSPTYPSPLTFNKGGTETQLYYNTASSFISWYYSGGDVVTASLSGGWNHIAVTRSGSTVYMFVNGILRNSATNANTFGGSASYPSYVGVYAPSSGSALGGFISNLHIVKGTALYTSNFIPPTGPISSVANTKLLCCQSNVLAGAATSSPNISGIINNGTVWSSTTNTSLIYGGSASMIFDGNATWSVGNYANFNPGAFTLFSGANVTANTSIRVYGNFSSSDNFKINGTTYTDNANGNNQWIVPSGVTYPITVNSIVIDTTGGAQNTISAVEIDGTILTDPVVVYGNAAATNFNPFTVNINTQRGKQSGWCTWNPLGAGTNITLSNGNLNATSNTNDWRQIKGTIGVTSGKWYWECTNTGTSGTFNQYHGISNDLETPATNLGTVSGYCYGHGGDKYAAGTNTSGAGATYTTGDVIGMALDLDSGTQTIKFYKNGILQFTQTITGSSPWYPASNCYYSQTGPIFVTTFGQKPFKFPPPAGFQPLALANTPRPTIVRPDQFMGVTTYSGNDGTQSINIGFKPDFVWSKGRNNTSNHLLMDTVRGGNKVLITDVTDSEYTGSYIQSFNTNGYTINSTSSGLNASGYTYVNWAWKAGGNSNTYNINDVGYATASAAGLTAGTITPTGASVNTKSGFSIITYTGPNDTSAHSFSHGLGKKPSFIIIKNRDRGFNWDIYHSSLGYNSSLIFTTATTRSGAYSAEPDSTIVNVQWNYTTYQNDKYVAYCWAEIPGFSKFGSYTGNGSSDGPFVYTGFRPRWILIRSTSAARDWLLYDTARGVYNENVEGALQPNTSGTAYNSGYTPLDILSNGFKPRISTTNFNANGETHIYAAFAETPTQNLYGAQSNAR